MLPRFSLAAYRSLGGTGRLRQAPVTKLWTKKPTGKSQMA
jgi:hypothetical protein